VCPQHFLQEVLVGNYSLDGDSDSRDSGSSQSTASSSGSSRGSDAAGEEDSNNTVQQYDGRQQQQQYVRPGGDSLPPLELRSFSLHPSGSHIAVGVRRQGVCAVDVYDMSVPAAATGAAPEVTAAAAAVPQVYTVRSKPGLSGGSGSTDGSNTAKTTATAAAAATVSAAATAAVSAARLSWVLVLEEPTLVLDVLGVMTNSDMMQPAGVTHPGDDSLADSWLAISVSGITSPTAVYYVNMQDPQQQVQVSKATGSHRQNLDLQQVHSISDCMP
jgi:hypothetical protein